MVVPGQLPQKLSFLGQRFPHRLAAALQVPDFRGCQEPLPEAKDDVSQPCRPSWMSCAGKWRRFGRKCANCAVPEKVEGREMGFSLRHNRVKTTSPHLQWRAGSVYVLYQSKNNLWRIGRMEVDDFLYKEEVPTSSKNGLTVLIIEEEPDLQSLDCKPCRSTRKKR